MPSFRIKSGCDEIVVRYLIVLKTQDSRKATAEVFNPLWELAEDVVSLPESWAERRRIPEGQIAFAFSSKFKWVAAKLAIMTNAELKKKVLMAVGANNISWHTNS